jgi:uncharacterized membrane protein
MVIQWFITVLLPLTLILGALLGGFYAAFSLVIFPALTAAKDSDASDFMVKVNKYAERAPFLSLFFLGLLSSIGYLGQAITHGATVHCIGAALVLGGGLLTICLNVPLNRALDQQKIPWKQYRDRWIRANTLRAVASLAGVILLLTDA